MLKTKNITNLNAAHVVSSALPLVTKNKKAKRLAASLSKAARHIAARKKVENTLNA